MRLYEFNVNPNDNTDNLVLVLKNLIGRSQSKKQAAVLNWASINQMLKMTGQQQLNYDAFKQLYDTIPAVQNLVHNFNADGIELEVPGVENGEGSDGAGESDLDQSKDAVNKAAASAAPKQLSQNSL